MTGDNEKLLPYGKYPSSSFSSSSLLTLFSRSIMAWAFYQFLVHFCGCHIAHTFGFLWFPLYAPETCSSIYTLKIQYTHLKYIINWLQFISYFCSEWSFKLSNLCSCAVGTVKFLQGLRGTESNNVDTYDCLANDWCMNAYKSTET